MRVRRKKRKIKMKKIRMNMLVLAKFFLVYKAFNHPRIQFTSFKYKY